VDSSTSLYGFADIVGYSQLSPYQQAACQERLVKIIDASLADAGVRPDAVQVQNQGDARMLVFPDAVDVSRVLAVMPRHFNGELKAYNRDMADHVRLRVRLSFAIGASAAGMIGNVGSAPIAAVRLNSASALRAAMTAAPDAYLGVIIDDYLHRQYVAQEFRPDLDPDEYASARVSFPDKGFEAEGWIRLVGYPASALQGQPGAAATFTLPADAVRPRGPAKAPGGGPVKTPQAPETGSGGNHGRRRRRGRLRAPQAMVIAAVITAAASVGIYVASADSGKTGASPPLHTQSQSAPATSASSSADPSVSMSVSAPASATKETHSTGTGSSPGTAAGVTVYGDWGPGVAVYADNRAAASNAPVIPFNQQVEVSCFAPNESGISSINAFYLLASGPWKGTYASANEFTNGGAHESAADPSIDSRVKPCPVS
jgi:hypothetical protein